MRTPKKNNLWEAVKWFFFTIAVGAIAGSALAFEYHRSDRQIEEIPSIFAKIESVNSTGMNSAARIAGSSSESNAAPIPTITPAEPVPQITPTPWVPAPTMTDAEIFKKNDSGEISDAEAKRLLTKTIFSGDADGLLTDQAKGILSRVWSREGRGKKLFITLTHAQSDDTEIDGFPMLEFEEPNKIMIVIPEEPKETSNGLVYGISFVSLAMGLAEDPHSVPDSWLRKVYEYATEYEYNEIRDDCQNLDSIYCDLFNEHSRPPR